MILHTDLRPTAAGLVPAGEPEPLAAGATGRLIHVFSSSDGLTCFYQGPAGLTAITPAGKTVTIVSRCPSRAAVIESGADEVTVMADGDTSVWRYADYTWRRSDVAGTLGGPVVTASPLVSLQQVMASRKLKGSYPTVSTPLTADDRATLTADISAAYRAMSAQAAAAGAFFQPVVARIRSLDSRGRTVALTPPVLLLPSASSPLSALLADRTLTFADGSFSALGEGILTGTAYTLAVSWPSATDAAWENRVEEIVVEVSEPVEPLAKGALSLTRMTRRDASSATLRTTLPGVGLDGDAPTGVLRQIIDRLETINAPAYEARLRRRSDGTWPSGRISLSNAGRRQRAAETADSAAGAVGINGDIIVAGDITRQPVEPESPSLYAATTEGSAWGGSVKVTLNRLADNGKQASLVATFRGDGSRPTSLSPLLVYPGGDGASLRIAVGTTLAEVELTPTSDGTMTYYLNPTLKPVTLADSASALVPAENRPGRVRCRGELIVSDVSRPMEALCRAALPEGVTVRGITAAARSRSSWDFGRAHFYVFTDAGIYAAAVNSARSRIDLSVIDRREVSAWAPSARGIMAASGRSLLRLNGAGVTDLSSFPSTITALGCDNSRGELWIATTGAAVTVADPDGRPLYRRSMKVSSMAPYREGFVASSPTGAWIVGGDERRTAAAIVYDAIVGSGLRRRPRCLELWLTSSAAELMVELYGDGGDEDVGSRAVARFAVSGELNAPLILPLITPRRARWRLKISGKVSPDTLISKISLQ